MLINSIKKNEPIKTHYKIKSNDAKLIFIKKGYFYPKFFSRVVGIVLNKDDEIIKNWHFNSELSKWSLKKILSFTFLGYDFFLSKNILFFFNFFNKTKDIYLNDNDLVLFGGWPNIYYHKLIDFLLRINFIKSKKYRYIYVPIYLKIMLQSKPYSKIFSKLNFQYYSYDNKIVFHNLRYASSINYFKDNILLRKSIKDLNKNIIKKFKLKSNKYKFTLISRKKSTRGLDNEDELFKMLKKFNFQRIYFEDLSFLEQIKVCYNSKIVVGVQGSGLANLIFMKKNSHLVHLSNVFINNPQVKELAISTGIKFHDINFEKNDKKNFTGSINVKSVEEKIISILKSS